MLPLVLALLGASSARVNAQAPTNAAHVPGSFELAGSSGVSAMMVFLGNEEKVYILDKSENNPVSIAGHPAWGSVWDIATRQTTLLDVYSNTFCAAGMHLPNGTYATFGGNHGVSPGPNGSPVDADPNGLAPVYGAADGRRAIRLLTPCTGDSNSFAPACQWYENRTDPGLMMQKERWYPAAEPLKDGSIVLLGGMVNGGYINRQLAIKDDPVTWGNISSNNYEFFPPRDGFKAQTVNFLVNAGGLNLYAHTYLMPSGKVFVQANISTMLWDVDTNTETPLPNMPNDIVRVYPASGATAMLPLTPENNWTPTILFCGGTNGFTDEQWGDQGGTRADNWLVPASKDCQRITPEPTDGSAAAYSADDDLPIGRTMGQFIHLPDETMLLINGGANGTAAYLGAGTPYGQSLATAEVLTPAIYTPTAAPGQRFSSAGLQASKIPRLYHSAAVLLPDASVFVAGSNPNADYNGTTVYPTEARIEVFYPPYFNSTRPTVSGIPSTLSYGGPYFNLTIGKSSLTGDATTAAKSAKAVLIRSGFTTHALNMGQRSMRLNSTYTIERSGDITLHVAQLPPNANLYQPGPALFFVVVNGIPSVGKMVILGSGQMGEQPVLAVASLPASRAASGGAASSGASSSDGDGASGLSSTAKIAIIAGGVAVVAGAVAVLAFALVRRRRRSSSYVPVRRPYEPMGGMGAVAPLDPYGGYGHSAMGSTADLMPPHGRDGTSPGYLTPYRDESVNASAEYLHSQQPMRHA